MTPRVRVPWRTAALAVALSACGAQEAPTDPSDSATEADARQGATQGNDQGAGAANSPGIAPMPGQATGDDGADADAPGDAGDAASGPEASGRPGADDGTAGSGDNAGTSTPADNTDSQVPPPDNAEPVACTRELLKAKVDTYFAALAAHDPSTLSLGPSVRFTENGEALALGEGLWKSAGAVVYMHSMLDTTRCSSASEAVVPEGDIELPVSLRLKLEHGLITEVETIVARPGDYVIFGSAFRSNPEAIVASASLGWADPVPAAERATRDELEAWITRYLESFPNGGCNLADDCKRLENGGGSFACSLGASCSTGSSGGGPAMAARLVLSDEVAGIAAGYTMFMGNTDMHMILMRGGEVQAVHAVLSGANGPGWE